MGDMHFFLDGSETAVFLFNESKDFGLTRPSSDKHILQSIGKLILLNLISIDVAQPLSFHRPDIYHCISIESGCHYILLLLRNPNTRSIRFQNIPGESLNFFEVNTFLTTFKFIVDYGLVKVQCGIVVMLPDCYCGCCIVV